MCHAIGQACATVHTAGHAIGYPLYDLSAIIHSLGLDNCKTTVENRKQEYISILPQQSLCRNNRRPRHNGGRR